MREKCAGCNKVHDDTNWKYTGDGWICSLWFKPRQYEWTPKRIKESRKKYAKDIIQPYRGGSLSQEFVEAYPREVAKMVRKGAVSKKEVARARNVWK